MASSVHMSERRPEGVLATGMPTLALFLALAGALPARAQVIEIGADGAVSVYDRPAVFTDSGAATIPAIRTTRARVSYEPPPAAGRTEVLQQLSAAASAYSLNPALVHAVAWRESRFRHDAVSSAGAAGVMQLMPETARSIGVDRFDLRQNIYGGAAYLRRMLDEFGGDVTLGLAAYNAGPAAVHRYGGVPPYAETRNYVAAILGRLADQGAVAPPIR